MKPLSAISSICYFWALVCMLLPAACDMGDISKRGLVADDSILPRSSGGIVPDSVFELHNHFISWVFDSYMDSIEIYSCCPEEYIKFGERKWYEYTGDPATDLDVLVYGDELIFAAHII